MKLAKFISRSGAASRRRAQALVGEGRVAVNNRIAQGAGVRIDPCADVVTLDGRVLKLAARRWIVAHKPAGVLCTRADTHGRRTIYDVLPGWAAGLPYVGRLDLATSGLLLLTNDGDLAAALAHPRNGVEREYVARVEGVVTARLLRALRRGVELDDGPARPKLVRRVRLGGDAVGVRLVLTEGRKREVRRLLKAAGHPVEALERVRFGPFRLGGLKEGGWRPARADELAAARALVERRGRRGSRRTRGGGHA